MVAIAHVEPEPLAPIDDVQQHRTELLELVDVVEWGLVMPSGSLPATGCLSHIVSGSIPIMNW